MLEGGDEGIDIVSESQPANGMCTSEKMQSTLSSDHLITIDTVPCNSCHEEVLRNRLMTEVQKTMIDGLSSELNEVKVELKMQKIISARESASHIDEIRLLKDKMEIFEACSPSNLLKELEKLRNRVETLNFSTSLDQQAYISKDNCQNEISESSHYDEVERSNWVSEYNSTFSPTTSESLSEDHQEDLNAIESRNKCFKTVDTTLNNKIEKPVSFIAKLWCSFAFVVSYILNKCQLPVTLVNGLDDKVKGIVSILANLCCGFKSTMTIVLRRYQVSIVNTNEYPDTSSVSVDEETENEVGETFSVLEDIWYSFLSEMSECFRGSQLANTQDQESNDNHAFNLVNVLDDMNGRLHSFIADLYCSFTSIITYVISRCQVAVVKVHESPDTFEMTENNNYEDDVDIPGTFVDDLWSDYTMPEPDESSKLQLAGFQAYESPDILETSSKKEYDDEDGPYSFVDDLWSDYVMPEPDMFSKLQLSAIQVHELPNVLETTAHTGYDYEMVNSISFVDDLWSDYVMPEPDYLSSIQLSAIQVQESPDIFEMAENNKFEDNVGIPGTYVDDLWSDYTMPEPDELSQLQLAGLEANESPNIPEMTLENEFDDEDGPFSFVDDLWSGYAMPEPDDNSKIQLSTLHAYEPQNILYVNLNYDFDNEVQSLVSFTNDLWDGYVMPEPDNSGKRQLEANHGK